MSLDSDLLRTFVAVSDSGSFTRAGEVVGRTQSAISLQMKRLEELAGGALFERGSRGVAPTRLGQDLLTNARRVLSLLEETSLALRAPPLTGPVRLGLPEEYGHAVLARALGAFAARHAGVEVTVRYGSSAENLSRLTAGDLDLAVLFDWQTMPSGEVLRHDPTVWVTSERHRIHERSPLPVALYTSSGWCTDYAIKSLKTRHIAYRVAFTSDTNGGLKLAVAAGLAVRADVAQQYPGGLPRVDRRRGIRRHRRVPSRSASQPPVLERGHRHHGLRAARRVPDGSGLMNGSARPRLANNPPHPERSRLGAPAGGARWSRFRPA